MPRRSPLLLTLLLLLCPLPAFACLNDRDSDSLASESRKFPDVVQVATGRFERNPPLFYQMRIDRVANELKTSPDKLNLYDDIAVACDRIGKDDDAIAWIEKKHARLTGDPFSGPEHEAWYRYYANVGTFHAHNWFRSGANKAHMEELKEARDDIAYAIKIKPNAHFGREKFQLAALEWVLAIATGEQNKGAFCRNLPESEALRYRRTINPGAQEAIEGLSGLIVLGNAWESPDIFGALSFALGRNEQRKIGYMAFLRCQELLKSGHASFDPEIGNHPDHASRLVSASNLDIYNEAEVEKKYHELRDEAERWQKRRTDYTMARMKQGRHPDTDPIFWKDYHPRPAPAVALPYSTEAPTHVIGWLHVHLGTELFVILWLGFYAGVYIVLPILVIRWLYLLWTRLRAKR